MHLISGDTLTENIAAENGTLARWVSDASLNDQEIVERIFLSTLVRPPTERERNLALAPIRANGPQARREAFEDAYWAIFNSKEFLFNH